MNITIQRAYIKPKKTGAVRVLADRLWPRGVSKVHAKIDVWAKELAPTSMLRAWFHVDPEDRYTDFAKKYQKELSLKKALARALLGTRKNIVLVTGVKDLERSHIPTLTTFLRKL